MNIKFKTTIVQILMLMFLSFFLSACHLVDHTVKAVSSRFTLNPASSKVRIRAFNAGKDNYSENLETENKEKAIVLIHGIYGATNTFGDLPKILHNDREIKADIFLADYWSTAIFPNIRSLSALGKSFSDSITNSIVESNKKIKDIYIIAHSQGGLIAQQAIVSLAQECKISNIEYLPCTCTLCKIKRNHVNIHLFLFSVPSLGSNIAKYSQKLFYPVDKAVLLSNYVNPLAYAYSPIVWNRQAYDMKPESIFLRMLHQEIQNARREEKINNVTMYTVSGTKSFGSPHELNDTVVGFRSAAYATRGGVDKGNHFLVPYMHFGEIVNIEREDNYSYILIKSLIQKKDLIINAFKVPGNNSNHKGRDFRGGFGFSDAYFVRKMFPVDNGYIDVSVKMPEPTPPPANVSDMRYSCFKGPYLIPPSYQSKDSLKKFISKSLMTNPYILPITIPKYWLDALSDFQTEFKLQSKAYQSIKKRNHINESIETVPLMAPPLDLRHFVLAQNDKYGNIFEHINANSLTRKGSFTYDISSGQDFSIKIVLRKEKSKLRSIFLPMIPPKEFYRKEIDLTLYVKSPGTMFSDMNNQGSSLITTRNIYDWGALLQEIQEDSKNHKTKLLKSKLNAKQLEKLLYIDDIKLLTGEMKEDIITAFNEIKDNLVFYKGEVASNAIYGSRKLDKKFCYFLELLEGSEELMNDMSRLSDSQKEDIKWFNIAILEKLFPQILLKKRNTVCVNTDDIVYIIPIYNKGSKRLEIKYFVNKEEGKTLWAGLVSSDYENPQIIEE